MIGLCDQAVLITPDIFPEVQRQPLPSDAAFCPQLPLHVGPECFNPTERDRRLAGTRFRKPIEPAAIDDGRVPFEAIGELMHEPSAAERTTQFVCRGLREDVHGLSSMCYVQAECDRTVLRCIRSLVLNGARLSNAARHTDHLGVGGTPHIGGE